MMSAQTIVNGVCRVGLRTGTVILGIVPEPVKVYVMDGYRLPPTVDREPERKPKKKKKKRRFSR